MTDQIPFKHKNWLSPQERLIQALDFNADDLAANRAGMMSERQIRREKRRMWLAYGFIGFAPTIVAGCALLNFSVNSHSIFGLVFLAIALVVIALGATMIFFLLQDLFDKDPDRTIKSLQGHVERRSSYELGRWRYKIVIRPSEIQVPEKAYDAFIEGEEYILYYTPYEMLLSAEHIDT